MRQKRVVVTGAAGMLGSAVVELAPEGITAVGVDLPDGDLTDPTQAMQAVADPHPSAVIHCAAYTDVDGCTRDPELAFRVNAEAAGNVARACRACGAHLVAISTDYVFDGEKGAPYDEDDEPAPINPYGESKLEGERRAAREHDRLLIVRTQWLFGPGGKNFVGTIVTKGRELGSLKVVADEFGSPTFTRDLAVRLWELVAREAVGTVHCTNSGVCSWAELAREALVAAGSSEVQVQEISRTQWESPTRRPRYSPLTSVRLPQMGLAPLRSWREAVRDYARDHLRG